MIKTTQKSCEISSKMDNEMSSSSLVTFDVNLFVYENEC